MELWLSFIYGSYNGAMVVFLTEIMPADVRTTGFSLAYSLATAIFGGFTPAISHLSDSGHRQPRHAGIVAVVRGGRGTDRRHAGASAFIVGCRASHGQESDGCPVTTGEGEWLTVGNSSPARRGCSQDSLSPGGAEHEPLSRALLPFADGR